MLCQLYFWQFQGPTIQEHLLLNDLVIGWEKYALQTTNSKNTALMLLNGGMHDAPIILPWINHVSQNMHIQPIQKAALTIN